VELRTYLAHLVQMNETTRFDRRRLDVITNELDAA